MSFLCVIHDKAHDGAFNMAVDELLFRKQIQRNDQNPILRFYQFSEPQVTVGYGMWRSVRSELNSFVPAIRRLTGGGIVHHGTDLTYSIMAPFAEYRSLRKVRESYFTLHHELKRALSCFGINAHLFERNCNAKSSFCFDSPVPFDVMLGEKKVAGAGQKRSMGFLLHQGSIAWDVLIKNHPHLELEAFARRFASCLAERFGLPIKEVPLHDEETKEMRELSWA